MSDRKEIETTTLLRQVWAMLLIGMYFACFMNEYYYPGFRDQPLEGEEIFWQVQRVLFFGLLGMGFLVDIVQMRADRDKAFRFIFLSLILGGLSGFIGAFQFKLISGIFGQIAGVGGPGLAPES
ncbi:MAG: hypothetical protein ACE5GQ_03365 [Nitrospinales bacterium]